MKKLSIFLVLATTVAFSQQTYLHCGAIFDAPKGKLTKEQTIVVEGNKIIQLQKGYIQPTGENTTVIDLKNKTVLPGFIDMHVHIENEYNATSYINQFVDNDADTAYDAALYAQRTLLAGFTTVRDMGGSGVNVSLRDAIAAGKVPGPRIFTAEKAIGTTGGHADPTNGSKKSLMGDPGPAQGVINSPEDGKKAVRQRYKNGADCIKITATGGVLSVAKNGQNPQFTLEEIKSIVSTANDYGMHVAAHAHGDEGMYRAVLGGVTTIEHGTLMSVRTMDLMKEKNAYLVATITAGKQVAEKAKIKGYFPDVVTPKALEIGPQIQDTFGRAYKRGVPIAFGTDAGVYPHGLNALEFGYMVEAGIPEVKALQSATITNARLLKSENELGQIAVGFYADIIATDSNPLEDINTLESIPFVMKNGLVYKQD
jgi:imidazolonepropionase-like amidohydrolase